MENNIELIKNIIRNSNILSTLCIYDNNNKELFNDGINITDNELDKIRDAFNKQNNLFLNGIKVNNKKYILLNTSQITDNSYLLHCKKYNEGYICIIVNNIIIMINYIDEYIPYQYDTKIQHIIKEIKELLLL